MFVKVGINGLGRIGKCVLLQLLNDNEVEIVAINAVNLTVYEIEDYLNYDSAHKASISDFKITSDTTFSIGRHNIKLLGDRMPEKLKWNNYGCQYLIDATGAFLTKEKCQSHDVDYVLMSAPAKDDSPTYIYGANHKKYTGEKIISASSCTTNCLAPTLKLINDKYNIKNCVFTTIHAATASQYTVDVFKKAARTNRSIFNNIIPHSTGASSSIKCVLPEMEGKIFGTSVRVPVINCSLLDLNIEFEDENIELKDIKELFENTPLKDIVYKLNDKNLVSCDFLTTTIPSILDLNASMNIGKGKVKLMIWYDNEWSYSAQMIRTMKYMYGINTRIKQKYNIKNIELKDKNIVARFDFNISVVNDEIIDDYRIASALPTIKYILEQKPNRLILTSHYGRPKNKEKKYSMEFMIPILNKYLDTEIKFLKDGLQNSTLENIGSGIYLLENLRYNLIETLYNKNQNHDIKDENHNLIKNYRELGDVFILDAFGCLHREHMSICDINYSDKKYGYGFLIEKELKNINTILSNKNEKILGIIGGAKIVDKMPFIHRLRKLPNTRLFIAGGLAKHYEEYYNNVFVMKHGVGNINLEENKEPKDLSLIDVKNSDYNFYDIGEESIKALIQEIDNASVIFWNGPLGVIEDSIYKKGSVKIAAYLQTVKNKKIIIGGGETASLFDKDNNDIYISTGGGALLEYIQKGTSMIGLQALTKY